jgi:polysaccharide export outer membrane protein
MPQTPPTGLEADLIGESEMSTQWRMLTILAFTLAALSSPRFVAGQSVSVANADSGDQPAVSGKPSAATVDDTGSAFHKRDQRYRIHPSDTLKLSFMLTPELDQTVTVQPDGYVMLRNAGDLPAAGHTLAEFTASIRTAYSKILHDPVISVDPTDFEKPYFVVGGQVGKPGKIEWRGDVTLTEAIAMAGGFTDAAKHSQVLLFRRVSDQWTQAKIINTKKMLNSRNLQEDPVLQPGDMLFVPKNSISKIRPFLPTTAAGAFYNPAATY